MLILFSHFVERSYNRICNSYFWWTRGMGNSFGIHTRWWTENSRKDIRCQWVEIFH